MEVSMVVDSRHDAINSQSRRYLAPYKNRGINHSSNLLSHWAPGVAAARAGSTRHMLTCSPLGNYFKSLLYNPKELFKQYLYYRSTETTVTGLDQ